MKKQEDYTYEELLKCHGKRFRANIQGVECKGKITVEDKSIYLCQNENFGAMCNERHGYKYSWCVTTVNGIYGIDFKFHEVTDFEVIEEEPNEMSSEEKIKLIQGYTAFFNAAKQEGRPVSVYDYIEHLEKPKMTKEMAISGLEYNLRQIDINKAKAEKNEFALNVIDSLQFAIEYLKNTEERGEIMGWANYYPDRQNDDKWGGAHHTKEKAENRSANGETATQYPIYSK